MIQFVYSTLYTSDEAVLQRHAINNQTSLYTNLTSLESSHWTPSIAIQHSILHVAIQTLWAAIEHLIPKCFQLFIPFISLIRTPAKYDNYN